MQAIRQQGSMLTGIVHGCDSCCRRTAVISGSGSFLRQVYKKENRRIGNSVTWSSVRPIAFGLRRVGLRIRSRREAVTAFRNKQFSQTADCVAAD